MKRCFRVTQSRDDFILTKVVKRPLGVFKERLIKMGATFDKNCCKYGVMHGRGFLYLQVITDVK